MERPGRLQNQSDNGWRGRCWLVELLLGVNCYSSCHPIFSDGFLLTFPSTQHLLLAIGYRDQDQVSRGKRGRFRITTGLSLGYTDRRIRGEREILHSKQNVTRPEDSPKQIFLYQNYSTWPKTSPQFIVSILNFHFKIIKLCLPHFFTRSTARGPALKGKASNRGSGYNGEDIFATGYRDQDSV